MRTLSRSNIFRFIAATLLTLLVVYPSCVLRLLLEPTVRIHAVRANPFDHRLRAAVANGEPLTRDGQRRHVVQ